MTPTISDADIVKMAKARAGFKAHALVYVLVNLFLAAVWFVSTFLPDPATTTPPGTYYWPIWPHLGWGLGLAIHGFFAFGPGQQLQAREEGRLRQKYQR